MANWFKTFSNQPHQPFFLSGIIFFISFILLLFASYARIVNLSSTILTYHTYSMLFIVFIQFILGYLYILFPKILEEKPIKRSVYMMHFYIYFFSSLGFLSSLFFSSEYIIFFTLALLLVQFLSFKLLFIINLESKIKDKKDTSWILFFLFIGLIAHMIFYVSFYELEYSFTLKKAGTYIGFYFYFFGVAFAISQRMILETTKQKIKNYKIDKSMFLMTKFTILIFFKVISHFYENIYFSLVIDILFFIFIMYELIRWKLPIFKVNSILWILYISLYWIPVSFLLLILQNSFEILHINFLFEQAPLHTLALGYINTLILAFILRATLYYKGKTQNANNITTLIFLFLQMAVILRLVASFSLNTELSYVLWINIASFSLVIILLLWFLNYLKIVLINK
ncbi:beta-carotene 15,15'-monooxygenase [Malaciobacter molluscorum]|uniref:NnrS family protein n=1 Tax=Malaciobacter molluscorum TaxID=1032072 RepID=UPI00100A5164|nr:NnrS family protein [Malaciobacter molluscorum]RXJ94558.1 beta-carotene 15,15'-monooxygenase [Malaciobacter molluscorum]